MLDETDTTARRICAVNPKRSSAGNRFVSSYTIFPTSTAFCQTSKSVKSRISALIPSPPAFPLPLAPRPSPLLLYRDGRDSSQSAQTRREGARHPADRRSGLFLVHAGRRHGRRLRAEADRELVRAFQERPPVAGPAGHPQGRRRDQHAE